MSTPAVERLHPALVHHLIGTLRWTQLRPLQEQAIDPLLAGSHALLGAPTAAGKTEAAMLPLLSRMSGERWSGVSVLYLCPLRALLNNLAPRIDGLCSLLGRRAAVWHGDVGDATRRRILAEPPDVLLTTPEAIEAMFLSTRVDVPRLLGEVRAVVVDEIHAFAGDDRGWHMLALLGRLDALRPLREGAQRVGLTATVGNPAALLDWLCVGAGDGCGRQVVMVGGENTPSPDLEVDWVASLDNAAEVIARLHRGEKRLAFADSRARVEQLAAALRERKITTFVSHSSLSADDRRQAERAFAESRDCVIVATSTLELGIDVGDLDRVVQLGAPRTVASVLQRVGRTGRRSGTVRNCLFLATSDIELLTALALARLVREGWVEPLTPPAYPVPLVAQQLLARVLAQGRLGRSEWPGDFGLVADASGLEADVVAEVLGHAQAHDLLLEDNGVLSIGTGGERLYGRRHFIELTSIFLSEPLISVRWGQRLLGQVDPSSFAVRDRERPVILLGGASWAVREVDWERRVAWVEPAEDGGRSRWNGSGGALSYEVCQAIRSVLVGREAPAEASRRAAARLGELRHDYWFAKAGATTAEQLPNHRTRWWTWAGSRANSSIGLRLKSSSRRVTAVDDLSVTVAGWHDGHTLREAAMATADAELSTVDERRLDAIKFNRAVPRRALQRMCERRDGDPHALARALAEPAETATTPG